jgi:hypothetical protein
MARPVPYLFCRYQLLQGKQALSGAEQIALLREIRGVMVPYRQADPDEADADTFSMKPGQFTIDGQHTGITWCVGYYLHQREEAEYNKDDDEIIEAYVETGGIRFTKFVAVPHLGVLAVADRTSETALGATAGISRFRSVVRHKNGAKAIVQLAATSEEVGRALKRWSVDQVSFVLRPFNPTARRLGRQLHALMIANGIGRFRGVAQPASPGEHLHDPGKGLVGEAVGLTQEGYGQIAVKGRTPEGHEASLGKPGFSRDKEENRKRQGKPRSLKIYFELEGSERQNNIMIAKALIEFYGP